MLNYFKVPYADLTPEALLNQALDGVNQWPFSKHAHLQQLKPISDAYYQACLTLSKTLVQALAQVIPCGNATYFEKAFDRHSSFLRLNYYPVLVDGVDAGAVDSEGTTEEGDRYVFICLRCNHEFLHITASTQITILFTH